MLDHINFYEYALKYHHLMIDEFPSDKLFGVFAYFHFEKGLTEQDALGILHCYQDSELLNKIIREESKNG